MREVWDIFDAYHMVMIVIVAHVLKNVIAYCHRTPKAVAFLPY